MQTLEYFLHIKAHYLLCHCFMYSPQFSCLQCFPVINCRYYNDILHGLYPLFGESEPDDAVRDNAAGAVARMIMVHPQSIPLNQVNLVCFQFPFVLQHHPALSISDVLFLSLYLGYISQVLPVFLRVLPLKEDHEESMAVYNCVSMLVMSSNPQVFFYLPRLQTC